MATGTVKDSWASANWLWPRMVGPNVALGSAREGTLAAAVAAILCLLDARSNPLFVALAALFAVLAALIWRMSLIAAATGLLLCVANLIAGLVISLEMSASEFETFSKLLWIVNGALALAFLNSIRGISAHRRMAGTPASAA